MSSMYTGLIYIEEQIEDVDFVEFEKLTFGRACVKLEPILEKYLLKHDNMFSGSYKSVYLNACI